MSKSPQRYQALKPDALHIKTWGRETVIYNNVTGSTHVLDSISGWILANLITSSLTANDIQHSLTGSIDGYQPDMDDDLQTYTEQLLSDFLALELIAVVN